MKPVRILAQAAGVVDAIRLRITSTSGQRANKSKHLGLNCLESGLLSVRRFYIGTEIITLLRLSELCPFLHAVTATRFQVCLRQAGSVDPSPLNASVRNFSSRCRSFSRSKPRVRLSGRDNHGGSM